MTDELKPVHCGCGGEAKVHGGGDISTFIRCQKCKIETKFYDTEAEAIEVWNRAMGAERGLDEWCTDCKEYDHEKQCCHRWNRVIKKVVDEVREKYDERTAKVTDQYSVGDHGKVYEYGACSACGAPVIKPDKYCSECGAKLEWK